MIFCFLCLVEKTYRRAFSIYQHLLELWTINKDNFQNISFCWAIVCSFGFDDDKQGGDGFGFDDDEQGGDVTNQAIRR